MESRKPPFEGHDKDEAGEPKGKTPLKRFEDLAKGLLNVSREELAEAERQHRSETPKTPRRS